MAEMDDSEPVYKKAYREVAQELLTKLADVSSPTSAQQYVKYATERITAAREYISEFYVGEFFNNYFREPVVELAGKAIGECEQIVKDTQNRLALEEHRINALLHAARINHDREAEHDLWREAETLRSEGQAAIDSQHERVSWIQQQLAACQGLSKALHLSTSTSTTRGSVRRQVGRDNT